MPLDLTSLSEQFCKNTWLIFAQNLVTNYEQCQLLHEKIILRKAIVHCAKYL